MGIRFPFLHCSTAPILHYFRSRLRFNSISILPSGRQLTTSAFVSQPLRAMPIPNRTSCKRSVRCASGLITHFTPFSFASGHHRQSRSSRFGAAFNSTHVPFAAAASNTAGISIVRLALQKQSPARMPENGDETDC